MHNPCFKKLAEAMGARGLIARTDAELEVALEEFVSYNDGPIVLDASVCKKEHVYVISHLLFDTPALLALPSASSPTCAWRRWSF